MDDGKIKTARIDTNFADSDSHNYTQQESESHSIEDIKDEGFVGEDASDMFGRLENGIADIFFQKTSWIFLIGLVITPIAFFCWDVNIAIKDRECAVSSANIKYPLLVLSSCIFIFIFLNFLLFKLSFLGLKSSSRLNTFFYYVNELSEHISMCIVLIVGFSTIYFKDMDYCVHNKQNLDLFLSDALGCFLITTFMFAMVKVFQKATSMDFNYSVYIKRIRRCLLEDTFISLLCIADIGHENWTDRQKLNKPRDMTYRNDAIFAMSDYISELHSYGEPVDELDLHRKRILLKEFQRLIRLNTARGNIFRTPQRIRSKAVGKARKMIVKNGSLGPVADLSIYFQKPNVFRFLLHEIGITDTYKFSRSSLADFIERVYKEQYLLKENLENMNSAIDKISFALKTAISGLMVLMLYIRAGGHGAVTTGIISAILGTQFISNSFSSNITNGILLLLFFHPYDIGDRVLIMLDGKEENLVVFELNVFSTVFYKWDGTYITILNTVLVQKSIRNLRRSGVMAESHRIQINAKTNQKKLIMLKKLVEEFVESNLEDYTEYVMLIHDHIEDASKLHMRICMQYRSSPQNFELYLSRKTKFLSFLNRTLQELSIEYIPPPRRILLRK